MGGKPRAQTGLLTGTDGALRCRWGAGSADYEHYHDTEWGFPVTDDNRLFEKICLEGFQSGLSWLTILRKRDRFREVFSRFDPSVVATYGARDVERLLGDAGIVRHRGKIESTINNAKRALVLRDEFGSLSAYFWRFVPPPSERPDPLTWAALMTLAKTPTSARLSKDLKKRGWSFVGPTTAYAFMQAMGLVNDHIDGCLTRTACLAARRQPSV